MIARHNFTLLKLAFLSYACVIQVSVRDGVHVCPVMLYVLENLFRMDDAIFHHAIYKNVQMFSNLLEHPTSSEWS